MSRFSIFILVLVLLSACTAPDTSYPSDLSNTADSSVNYKLNGSNSDIMTLDELTSLVKQAKQNGKTVKGYGKTVFYGTKPEKFDVEILDIVENFIGEGYDCILFRFDSPFIRKEDSSIVAGMSGSPIFVNDKTVGALAYGYSWGRVNNRLGFATPIEYMLQELETKSIKSSVLPTHTGGSPSETGVQRLFPICMSGGLNSTFEKKIALLNEKFPNNPFKDFNFIGVGSDSKVLKNDVTTNIEAGSVLGAEFVGGDMSMAGIGTATYVKDNKVLAFGHPMMSSGTKYKFPMTTGSISAIIALFPRCFKQGVANKEIGSIDYDGIASINGTLGGVAPKATAKYIMMNRLTGQNKEINLTIVKIKEYVPSLVWMTVANSYSTMLQSTEKPILLKASVEGKLSDGSSFSFSFDEASTGGYYMEWPLYLNLRNLLTNPYKKVDLESINVNYEFIPNSINACIDTLWSEKSEITNLSEPLSLKVLLTSKEDGSCGGGSGGGFGGGG
ncbi:MAG: hypothetical protein HY606_09620 [Planctomycetes bacterium]|nr:hypothetical protein [Planctomycetota bacterium]